MADYADLVFEVKNVGKTIKDIVRVRKEVEKTGKETKNLQDTLVSGWSFGKVFQSLQKLGDAFRDVSITMRSFSEIYGDFNKRANEGVKSLVEDFQETERSAKKLMNLLGMRTMNLGLDPDEFTKINVELAKITEEISTATGQRLEEVGKKLSQSLAGEVGGLKDLGIVINSSSKTFKDSIERLKDAGFAEEAAKAMVIFGEIKKQSQKFSGSFKESAKSITQSFGNIENQLKSGVFPAAGKALTTILKPLLDAVDSLLSNDVVKHIGGIVVALGTLTVSVLLLKKTLGSLSEFIGLSGLLSKSGGLIAKIAPGLTKALAGLLPVITSGLAALGTALVAALPYILAGALAAGLTFALVKTVQLIKQKGFAGAAKAIGEWFTGLGESIANWFRGNGFKTNQELKQIAEEKEAKEFAKNLDKLRESINENIYKIVGSYNNLIGAFKNINPLKDFEKSKASSAEIQKKLKDQEKLIIEKLKYNEDFSKTLGESTDSFNQLTSSYFTRLKEQPKNKLYDTIVTLKEKFGNELKALGVGLKDFKKRIGDDGSVLVKEEDIDKIFGSEIFERDFLKIRKFILEKYNKEYLKAVSKAALATPGEPGTAPPPLPLDYDKVKEELLKSLGLDKDTFRKFEIYREDVLKRIEKELKTDKDYKDFQNLLIKIQEKYKEVFDGFKKGKENWKLDGLSGMDLDQFKALMKDNTARLQIGGLIKQLGQKTLKNVEDMKSENETLVKMREVFYNAINDDVKYFKEWTNEKWSAITNNISLALDLKIPSVDDIKERLKTQEDKIKKFKETFNFDQLIKEITIPDEYNASIQLQKKKDDYMKSTKKLADLFKISEDAVKKLSKEDISSRLDNVLKKEKTRLEDIEFMWKKQNDPYTEKEKISLLKELQQHYLDKFNIEMEGLEKERQYIEETNNFIQQTLSKALEWSPQGISAIQSHTMEGYKFMTSGFKDLGNFSSVINQKNNQEAVLQKQTNDLISKTKDVINDISKKIDSLIGDAPTLTLVN